MATTDVQMLGGDTTDLYDISTITISLSYIHRCMPPNGGYFNPPFLFPFSPPRPFPTPTLLSTVLLTQSQSHGTLLRNTSYPPTLLILPRTLTSLISRSACAVPARTAAGSTICVRYTGSFFSKSVSDDDAEAQAADGGSRQRLTFLVGGGGGQAGAMRIFFPWPCSGVSGCRCSGWMGWRCGWRWWCWRRPCGRGAWGRRCSGTWRCRSSRWWWWW